MNILQTKVYEESKVTLELEENFKGCHLYDFDSKGIFGLDREILTLIAKGDSFDEWAWRGNFNECTKDIEALFRKNVAEKMQENMKM